jgi:hypothetical protein
MTVFSHAFDFGFEVVSFDEQGEDVTPAMIRAELINRANNISDREIEEACGRFDSYNYDESDESYKEKISYKLLTDKWF